MHATKLKAHKKQTNTPQHTTSSKRLLHTHKPHHSQRITPRRTRTRRPQRPQKQQQQQQQLLTNTNPLALSKRKFTTQTPQSDQTTTTSSAQQDNISTEPRVIFESQLSKRERVLTLGLLGLGTFTSLQVAAGLVYAPDSSIIFPAILTLGSAGLLAYIRKAFRYRATQIVIKGPKDPVEVSVPGFFTQNVTHKIERHLFTGLTPSIDSRIFFDSKRPFVCIVSGRSPFFLNRKGLFDSSGPLNPILGYDVVTLERCAPSPPYKPKVKATVAKDAQEQQRDV